MKIAISSLMCAFMLTMLGVKGARATVNFTYSISSAEFDGGDPNSTYTAAGCPEMASIYVETFGIITVTNIQSVSETARTMITCFCGIEDTDSGPIEFQSDPYSNYGPYEYIIPGGGNSPPYDVSSSAAGSVGPGSYVAFGAFVASDEKTGDYEPFNISMPVTVSP